MSIEKIWFCGGILLLIAKGEFTQRCRMDVTTLQWVLVLVTYNTIITAKNVGGSNLTIRFFYKNMFFIFIYDGANTCLHGMIIPATHRVLF